MKKILFILLVFLSVVATAQTGNKDKLIRATDNLQADADFTVHDTLVPVLDVSYHLWSADGITWRNGYVLGDRYIKFSNDVKNTYATIDLLGLEQYWINTGTTLYNNTTYSTMIQIDTSGVSGNYGLYVNGNTSSDYYFLGSDSLMLTNLRSGDGTDGYVLSKSGDYAVWIPAATGGGSYGRNVGIAGYGVYEDTVGTEMRFRNIATGDSFIDVSESDSTIYIAWDGTTRILTAGVGLSGGGDLSANRTINLYIPELTEMPVTVDYAADWLVINDISTGTHYKIHPEDLLAVLGAYTDSVGIGLVGSTFYLKEPDNVSETSVNESTMDGHTHFFDMNSFELSDLGDVTNSPVSGEFLTFNGTSWVTADIDSITASGVDMYVDNVLKESSINKVNLLSGGNIELSYEGDGSIEIDDIRASQTLTYADTTQHDFLSGNNAIVTLTGDISLYEMLNVPDGGEGEIVLIQDAVGGYGVDAFYHAGLAIKYVDIDTVNIPTIYDVQQIVSDSIAANKLVLTTDGNSGVATLSNDTLNVPNYSQTYNPSYQLLSGTTPTLDVNDGLNAVLTMSGTTTLTLTNLIEGQSGNITVLCSSTAYTITLAGGYDYRISRALYTSGDVITTSGSSQIDQFSWVYDGTRVLINGQVNYQ